MENPISRNSDSPRIRRPGISWFGVYVSLVVCLVAVGCGAPGEPTAPSPAVPVAIADLTSQQAGEAVQLTFTMPLKTVSGARLSETPAIEVLRGTLKPDGTPDAKSFHAIETIPGALAGEYRAADKVQMASHLSIEELHTYAGATLAYRVRTRASRKRASADSNAATVHIHAVPERIASLPYAVTESAIELSWVPPTRNSSGDPLPPISEFHVYRGEIDPASAASAANDLSQAKWNSPLTLLASTTSSSYRDTTFEFGKTYLYAVRTVISADGSPVESSDSVPAVVGPKDVFPPHVPEDVVGVVIVGDQTNASPEANLSWSINGETDLAGYRVYRSEQQGVPGQLLTPDLLPSPAYRDISVRPGHTYWYAVTAIDRSGNESAPSAPVAAEVAQPSP
jgi:hypothetical protein